LVEVLKRKLLLNLVSLSTGISYFRRSLNFEKKIRPEIQYSAFVLARYPAGHTVYLAKSVLVEE
jgi:hypothetical protein